MNESGVTGEARHTAKWIRMYILNLPSTKWEAVDDC